MNRKQIFFILAFLPALLLAGCKTETQNGYTVRDGMIFLDAPARAEGQQSVLQLAVDPIPVVRVGFIGLGMRGPGAVGRFTHIEGVEIKALCDLYPESVERSQGILERNGFPVAESYSGEEGWKELCERDDIDLVYIATPWKQHVPMAVYAMEQGKHVAVEVPAAMSVAECWQLVDTSEKTRRHCMMLENCVYDFFELTTLNMAQQGVFGEILHAEGAYIHNLEPFWAAYRDNWRLEYNQEHRGDVYPTHGIGPVCQALNIHRGDKMNYLVAVDTKPVNGPKVAKEQMGADTYANGDHTSTLIRTEKGKSILIEHNVVTPRPYSRMYQLTGTEGFANKYPMQGYAVKSERMGIEAAKDHENLDGERFVPDEVRRALMEAYKHPIARDIEEKARQVGGHGGMDFIMDYRLVYCLQNGLPLDQDVYDAAEWSCLTEITAISLENNSMPVQIPDFTRGEWDKIDGLKFAL